MEVQHNKLFYLIAQFIMYSNLARYFNLFHFHRMFHPTDVIHKHLTQINFSLHDYILFSYIYIYLNEFFNTLYCYLDKKILKMYRLYYCMFV